MTRYFVIALIFVPGVLFAQFTYVVHNDVPVQSAAGGSLALPWGGGLNAAQYNTLDLNHDGIDDLVLFDRMANKVITYLRAGTQYQYAPQYESFFPPDVEHWMLLRDYNCDGRKDIFTSDVLGIKVFTNVTAAGESPKWTLYLSYSGVPGAGKYPFILTQGFTSKINLKVEHDDLPAITDADGDGDVDIINVRYSGSGVEFHQNLSMERYGTCDSLEYERIAQDWGNFKECGCGNFAFNGTDCGSGGRVKHSGGKSLLMLDINGDLKKDLLFSEADCPQLFALPNFGSLANPQINSFSTYPNVLPVNMVSFPAAFYEDVDFDGVKDLLATPNIDARNFLTADLNHSNWFYKNTGTNTNPVFGFQQNNFLQDQMVDVGDNAVPAFADADGDGDMDMFVSNNASKDFIATISFYENKGRSNDPTFQLITEDYLDFSALRYYNLKIHFADIDHNNTVDLAFTASGSPAAGVTRLFYLPNKSAGLLDFSNQEIQPLDFNFAFSENLCFTDVNADGKLDILVGRNDGSLDYWRNTGNPPQVTFALAAESFLGLEPSVLRQNIACSVADLNADGKPDLVYGDQTGKLKVIVDYRHATNPASTLANIVFNPLAGAYAEQNLGGRIWPVIVNLFNTDKPAIVVGNTLGGVQILQNDEGKSMPDTPEIEVYPNPIEITETLNIKIDRMASVQIISSIGQRLSDPSLLEANVTHLLRLPPLPAGMYVLKFTASRKSYTKRLVIY